MKKASIIIPVYNGEKYLKNSIRTIFTQTYPAIEVIAIDDGSTDSSWNILSELKEESPESVSFLTFTQANAGICATRNRGLELATGEYVFFMDQDDRLKKKYVETLVRTLEKTEADLVIGGYLLIDEAGFVKEKTRLEPQKAWSKFRISAPWGRVFRKKLIEDHHIRFMQTKISEDFYFNLCYMSYCQKIHVSDYSGYGWTFHSDSESHNNMSKLEEERNPLIMMTQVLKDMQTPNVLEPDLVEYMFVKHVIWYLLYTAKGASYVALKKNYQRCFHWLEEFFPAYDKNPEIARSHPEGEARKVQIIVFLGVKLHRVGLLLPLLRLYSML